MVEFAVADCVEPGPGEGGVAALDAFRDGEVEGVDAVDAIGFWVGAIQGAGVGTFRAGVGSVKVPGGVGGTATEDAVDDVPVAGVFDFGGIGFVGDADLAGATAVDGSVVASFELPG